jgi:hypothetical protein
MIEMKREEGGGEKRERERDFVVSVRKEKKTTNLSD